MARRTANLTLSNKSKICSENLAFATPVLVLQK